MAVVTVASGATGNTGALANDTLVWVEDQGLEFSTDAGTTYIPFAAGVYLKVASGITIYYRSTSSRETSFRYMPI